MMTASRMQPPLARTVALAAAALVAGLVGTAPRPAAGQPGQDEADYPHAYPREGVTKRFENERVIIWEVVWLDGWRSPTTGTATT